MTFLSSLKMINLQIHNETHAKALENSAEQAVQTDTGLNVGGLLLLLEPLFPHQ